MTSDQSQIVVVCNDEVLAVEIAELLVRTQVAADRPTAIDYSDFVLSSEGYFKDGRRILFIFDLFQGSGRNLRPEGIAIGDKAIARGHKALIVSPLSLAHQLKVPEYWDISSEDSLSDRVRELLQTEVVPISDRLRDAFQAMMNRPRGHG